MRDPICTRLIPGALLIFLLSACATAPQTLKLINQPPDNIPSFSELVEVPFFPQQDYQCGPASLATVLQFQGIEVTPDQLIDQVYIPERKGSLQIEMIATARSYGLLGYKIDPLLENILLEIDSGHPVLVFQNLALDAWPKWHYAVVVGYDIQKSELILRSGTYAQHTVSFSTFEKTWARADYWAYVFTQSGEIPLTASFLEHIKASHELEKSKGMEYAIAAYRSGLKRWPGNSLMLIALANAEYALSNWQASVHLLQKEISLRPNNATAWNNLAYALMAKDCKRQALLAAECAIELSPEDQNISDSYVEIKRSHAGNTGDCKNIQCPLMN